jgi:hypothetical protein
MTMMVHYVAELPDELDLARIGAEWRAHVGGFREVRFPDPYGPPEWLVPITKVRPNWGTLFCEVRADDLSRMLSQAFDPARRHAAIWVECY